MYLDVLTICCTQNVVLYYLDVLAICCSQNVVLYYLDILEIYTYYFSVACTVMKIIIMARAIIYLLVSIYSKQTQKLALKPISALSFEVRNTVAKV